MVELALAEDAIVSDTVEMTASEGGLDVLRLSLATDVGTPAPFGDVGSLAHGAEPAADPASAFDAAPIDGEPTQVAVVSGVAFDRPMPIGGGGRSSGLRNFVLLPAGVAAGLIACGVLIAAYRPHA